MSDPSIPESYPTAESGESFGEMFSQYERSHSRKRTEPGKGIEGTVIAVSGELLCLQLFGGSFSEKGGLDRTPPDWRSGR